MSGDNGGGQPGPKDSTKRQRALKRARVGWPPALRQLKDLLYEVHLEAGAPSLDEITEDIAADDDLEGAPSRHTVHRVITDGERSGQQADAVAVATVLARRAAWHAPDLAERVRALWVQARMAQGVGRPIDDFRSDAQLTLDRGLGIHPALDTDAASDRFGLLPAYIPRDHDAQLKAAVDAAVAGRSGVAVLVGGSSTGKTRSLWEAVDALPDGWRLWHPLTPTAPEAVLAALADIAPKTAVWLNEAQHYLSPDPLGEEVAAGLRELLTDPSRAPVLVLGSLWPDDWGTLTTRTTPDRHPGARALLSGHKIDVPKAFTSAELAALDATGNADPRLAQAARHADDAQVTQYLAGVPHLMDRYGAANAPTRALIHAAMDARRLGAGLHIPLAWLADAAPGYLTETESRTLETDWLPQALAYVTEPCNGIPGILTHVNTSRPLNQRTRRGPNPSPQGPHYVLADYIDQHGRHTLAETIPPVAFWTAAATHAHPADLTELGNAAWNRGLYRDAAQLHKNATIHGNPYAAEHLVNNLNSVHPGDPHPAHWAAAHVALDNPSAIAWLLHVLWDVGAHEQATVLAERAAWRAALDEPTAVAHLLAFLWEGGAGEQATTLLARNPAAHVGLDNPGAVVELLKVLWEGGAHEQATVLLARNPAAHASLHAQDAIAELLKVLWEGGAHEQATVLAERAAAHAALDTPRAVTELLKVLREGGAHEQATVLAERAAAHVALKDPFDLIWLLGVLREGGAHEQATALTARAARHVALTDCAAVTHMLMVLLNAGAREQAAALLARNPAAHVALDNPIAVARLLKVLLKVLRKGGAHEQATVLAERAAAHTALDNPGAVAGLLKVLWQGGAHEQATVLAGRAAAHTALDNPGAVAGLLKVLWQGGAHEQATVLAGRAAAHAALDDLDTVAGLLKVLWQGGAHEQATVLAERAAAHVALGVPYTVTHLLEVLRELGAHKQATVLTERLPAVGHFNLFIRYGRGEPFRSGREPDGSAAASWTWNDLD
ncbi:hypothetical protein [Streptomyces sp. NPDC001422]|uniref:hypothetical protein n=1 Tax=Streptomyces sp. NPDC001422 TaxID=3364575 RepID=UPI0036A0BF69